MAELMHKLNNAEGQVSFVKFSGESPNNTPILVQMKIEIAERTRVLEIVGLSISLLTLLISLIIFGHFR